MQIEIRGAERLSRRERQVVVLKEMGYSNAAIAKRLGIGQGSVATLYQRAKAKGYQVVIVLPGDALGLFDPGVDELAGEANEEGEEGEEPDLEG